MSDNVIQKRIDLMRVQLEKFDNRLHDKDLVSDLEYLADQLETLIRTNQILRDQIFNIEQAVLFGEPVENVLAAKLRRMLVDNDEYCRLDIEKDYLEITNSINNDIFVITIQKKFGKTPKQLLEQSEIRRLKATTKFAHLLRESNRMKEKLSKQEKDIQTLIAIRTDTLEVQTKSKEDIQRAIDQLNIIIQQYNITTFRKGLNKLSPSMQTAFHEAWQRAALANHQVAVLESANKKLKTSLLQKKSQVSRFSAYRKRGKIRNSHSK